MSAKYPESAMSEQSGELNISIFASTQTFPKSEAKGSVSQLRYAIDTAERNITKSIKNRGRMTDGEFRQFLGIAQGSTYEVQTQLLVARQLKIGNRSAQQSGSSLHRDIKDARRVHPVFGS
jgi:four helix bundle protein